MMMLVGFSLPVRLGGAVIAPNGEPIQYNAIRFLPTRAIVGVRLKTGA